MSRAEIVAMARRGTVIGLAALFALGCKQWSPNEPPQQVYDGMIVGGIGGAGGAGSGGGGAGGTGGTGGTDSDAGAMACASLPQTSVYACVHGDGINNPRHGEAVVAITGAVERVDASAPSCWLQAGWTFGYGEDRGERYVVRDGETEVGLTIHTGSERPLLTTGQRVRVAVKTSQNGTWTNDSVVFSVHDDASGELLYWFAQAEIGIADLALPPGLTAANAPPECMYVVDCRTYLRRGLSLHYGDDEVALEIGELARIGDMMAVLIDNTWVQYEGGDLCGEVGRSLELSIGLFSRGLVSQCDGLDASACSATDGCRDVRAYLVADTDPSPAFIACVEDDSCGDGDLVTCAINDETEQLADFTTTCVPPGWTVALGACDSETDAGAP